MEIIKAIESKYSNINTIRTKIITELKNYADTDTEHEKISDRKILRDYLFDKKKELNDIPKEPFNKEFQLEKLRERWTSYNQNVMYKLITGLYLFIPALRSDYAGAVVVKNKFNSIIVIKNLVKVNTDKSKTIEIPKILER